MPTIVHTKEGIVVIRSANNTGPFPEDRVRTEIFGEVPAEKEDVVPTRSDTVPTNTIGDIRGEEKIFE